MTFTLSFTNPGEIDIRGATIAGLNAKVGDSPIGFFGTGLKYSIASILRLGGSITIYSGTKAHAFGLEDLNFRDKAFMQVFMQDLRNGEQHNIPLGFTTEYGKTWEPWQLYRELMSNALDEGGVVREGAAEPSPGHTTIIVRLAAFAQPYADRDSIILPSTRIWATTHTDCQIGRGRSKHLYYRGIRVADVETALTYNLQGKVELTEDRTLKNGIWLAQERAKAAIASSADEALILEFLQSQHTFEKHVGFDAWDTYSPEFIAIAKRLWKQDKAKWSRLKGCIEAHGKDLLRPTSIPGSAMQQKMLARASAFCARMGVNPGEHNIAIAELGNSILGQYEKDTGNIYISPAVFAQGTKAVVSTLYEELIHAETGKEDCNYDMQTFLFNQIVTLYEEHVFGEPI